MPVLCNFDLGRNPRLEGEELNGPLSPTRGPRVQAWMSSWIAVGAAQDAVLPILVRRTLLRLPEVRPTRAWSWVS
jgi:hypothetical protein